MKFVVVSLVACIALTSCGKRNTVTIASSDGACVMHAEEKERKLKTGKAGLWIFSDSEPDWQATRIHFEVNGHHLELPDSVAEIIAEPHELIVSAKEKSSSEISVTLHRNNMACGLYQADFHFKNDKLVRATADGTDMDQPLGIYP